MKMPPFRSITVPVAALIAGLIIGLGVGQMQLKKEEKVCQDKIKEANKKVAFFQKKMAEDKTEAMASLEQNEQKCRTDLDKLQLTLRNEKKTLTGQLAALQEQKQKIDMQAKASEEESVKTKKELKEVERSNKELEQGLKKTTGEKQALQSDLKKTTKDLAHCASNNAELCVIADELLTKYRNKGVGAALLEREPLIQTKKVELEQLSQKYREEIEQLAIHKKDEEGK
jgi:chromosome segregation ATPase